VNLEWRESVMWWNHTSWSGEYWPMPWMFFGPVMMFLFMVTCVAIVLFIVRGATMHRNRAAGNVAGMMSCCGTGLGPSLEHVAAQNKRIDGSTAFDEYRAETLRRLEREQGEFQEFVEHLRAAKDKAEFDQFIAARRTPPQLPPDPKPDVAGRDRMPADAVAP
jgi:Protein of unknown function (DUF2852)